MYLKQIKIACLITKNNNIEREWKKFTSSGRDKRRGEMIKEKFVKKRKLEEFKQLKVIDCADFCVLRWFCFIHFFLSSFDLNEKLVSMVLKLIEQKEKMIWNWKFVCLHGKRKKNYYWLDKIWRGIIFVCCVNVCEEGRPRGDHQIFFLQRKSIPSQSAGEFIITRFSCKKNHNLKFFHRDLIGKIK